jgi:hypothetical protein
MYRFPLGRICGAGTFIPAAAVVSLSGCMSWRSEALSPAQLIATKNPPVVRVTRTDSSKVILREPQVAGDTLYGRPQSSLNDSLGDRTGIPLAGIHSIATHQSDPTKNTLLFAGIGVVTLGALCAADALGCGPEEDTITFANGTQ